MRQTWIAILGTAVALAMTGCHQTSQNTGGGGGQSGAATVQQQQVKNPGVTSYDNSNPVSREEESTHAAQLRAVPPQAIMNNKPGRVIQAQTTLDARNGMPARKLDVNHATVKQLETLPGVNANLAADIHAHRPYKNAQDLSQRVPSLSPSYAAQIARFLTFGSHH